MRRIRSFLLPCAAVLALAGPGCTPETPMEPADLHATPDRLALPPLDATAIDPFSSGRAVVDLGLQRLTRVEGVFRTRTILTGQEPGPWEEFAYSTERRVVGEETPVAGGPTYRRERVDHVEPGTVGLTNYDLWRQDRSGLYLYQPDLTRIQRRGSLSLARAGAGATPALAAAFARAFDEVAAKREALLAGPPGGALEKEVTFLRYPLHKGASWEGRIDFNVWTVEDIEWIDTPGGRFRAARMRIELPRFFGPKDHALTWWDAPGEVKREYRLFGDAIDGQGNVLGEVEATDSFELVSYVQDASL